jgi:3D (Asp-Asp-Asp) domain-containing protein
MSITSMKLDYNAIWKREIMRHMLLIGVTLVTLLSGCTQTYNNDDYLEMYSRREVGKTWTTEVKTGDYTVHNDVEEVEVIKPTTTTFKVTAYCPCIKCCGKTDGITATGTVATAGRTIAVDPTVIPYGSEVILNGVTYIAEDCGGAIKGNKIDMFFDTHEEALQWGVKYIEGVVIK